MFDRLFPLSKNVFIYATPQIFPKSQNWISARFRFRCWRFGIHLGIHFLNMSWHPEHCYFATNPLPNAYFNIWSLSFWDQFPVRIWCFFGSRFWTHLFMYLFLDILQNLSIWGPPPKSNGGQHGIPNRQNLPKRLSKASPLLILKGAWNNPCFHETIIFPVPLGPGGF